MKLFAILALCLLAFSARAQSSKELATGLEELIDGHDTSQNWQDKQYTINCIKDGIDEIKGLIKLGKDIYTDVSTQQYELLIKTAIQDGIPFVKGAIKLINECKALFCYGPSKKKCEAQNAQGCEEWGYVYYPKCKEGFTNFGCCECANQCPEGFTDNGLYCLKPKAYGRGWGYAIWHEEKCNRENSQGCEKNGLMWYPKCKPGFHNVGCCICSPDCPEGWTDIGISCKKPEVYGRGWGYPVTVGQECLRENLPKTVDCKTQGSAIDIVRASVEQKLQHSENASNGDKYQQGFTDNVRHLADLIDTYHKQCFNQTAPAEEQDPQVNKI